MKRLHRRIKTKPVHVLARVKNELGLRQKEIPELLGIPLDTFKNIIHGKVKSWHQHATTISRVTGISVECLLANNSRMALISADGNRWVADDYRAGIATQYAVKLSNERNHGRHTLQYFRLLMIKVGRCLLAAYQTKESRVAFFKLRRAINEIGESFTKFSENVPLTAAEIEKLPEPERTPLVYAGQENTKLPGYSYGGKWYPKRTYIGTNGQPVLPQIIDGKPTKCALEDWDREMQSAIISITSRSRKGVQKVYGGFVREIIAEERRQNVAGKNDLEIAEERAAELRRAKQRKETP